MAEKKFLMLLASLMEKCQLLINIHLHKSLSASSEVCLSQIHNTIVINLADVLNFPGFMGTYQMCSRF